MIINKLNRKNRGLEEKLPVKIVQFGEGNFLRAFADYAFQKLNYEAGFNGGVAVVQPRAGGGVQTLNDQDGLYTLFMNGVKKNEKIQEIELIKNIVKGVNPFIDYQAYLDLAKEDNLEFIISNTTEAGIEFIETDTLEMQPEGSFPARLTVLLHERFKYFKGDNSKGLTIIPCELINYNAATLKEIIFKYCDLWNLDNSFESWLSESCTFHNTLVDRIVPGYPKNNIEEYNNQLDYTDNLIVTAEPFFLWVIEGDDALKQKLPFHKTDLNVKIVDDMQDFRTLKVRILNGAHTAMVPFSLLLGNETVRETVDGDFTGDFVKQVLAEINETLPFDKQEIVAYSDEVMDRFRNPFIVHKLSDIALNSISKFKIRVLPSLLEYIKISKKLPIHLTFSFACLLRFYKKEWQGTVLPINDTKEVISYFEDIWQHNSIEQVVQQTLANIEFWEKDFNEITGLSDALIFALKEIESNGIENGFINYINHYQS